jgi:hypothetical protein
MPSYHTSANTSSYEARRLSRLVWYDAMGPLGSMHELLSHHSQQNLLAIRSDGVRGTMHFLGFEPSKEFKELWSRLQVLEVWRELSIRPTWDECHPDDRFLLPHKHKQDDDDNIDTDDENNNNEYDYDDDDDDNDFVDDLQALTRQSDLVRTLMNDIVSTLAIQNTIWDEFLVVEQSQIPSAGLGLFYRPDRHHRVEDDVDTNPNTSIIPPNTIICYYTGHIHSYSSSMRLVDNKSYLLSVRGDLLVDPRHMFHVKARYINDPLHDENVNCVYKDVESHTSSSSSSSSSSSRCSRQMSDVKPIRMAVVTRREILPGEELFVSYGEAYWNQHQDGRGTQFLGPKSTE